MDNYKILQKLGKGAQGEVYLVENKVDKLMYVLKKIECNDETEANKAFKEAMALQELKHPYICGYKEFFVTWDRENAAMFVCIVMQYYKMGDLEKCLKQKRSKYEPLGEKILKKWFGQLLESLVFVHNKKVIHRDLKPSNIFITNELDVALGDFGVATFMNDARTKACTTVGTMNWMAPEVLERPYDERSDVWSLGCILLEMASCSFLDSSEISGILFEMKSLPHVLEEALMNIAEIYTADLCQVIRTLLRRNYQQRPTANQLLELPYVQECLSLSESNIISKENIQKNVLESINPAPRKDGVEAVVTYMENNLLNSNYMLDAFDALLQLFKQDATISIVGKKLIIQVMRKHIAKNMIQLKACTLLAILANKAAIGDEIFSKQFIAPVMLAMKSHPSFEELQIAAMNLLLALSVDEDLAKEIGKLGGVQDTLSALRSFPDSVEIATCCCGVLWSLAIVEENVKILSEERGLRDIRQALDTHIADAELAKSACSALWALSMEEGIIDSMADFAVISLLLQTLNKHNKVPKVVKNALLAISSIVEVGESCANEFLTNNLETSGIKILCDAFIFNKDNSEVAENFASCIAALAKYDDLRPEINTRSVNELLNDTRLKFITNQDVSTQVERAISLLNVEV